MANYSAAPGTPQTPAKSLSAAGIAALVSFGTYYVADVDPFTKKEIVEALILAVVASGLTGVGTFFTKNRAK